VPACAVVKGAELTEVPTTGTVELKMGVPLQVGLFGPYRVKVIVPVGFEAPSRLALSKIARPTSVEDDAVLVRVGVIAAAGPMPATTTLAIKAAANPMVVANVRRLRSLGSRGPDAPTSPSPTQLP